MALKILEDIFQGETRTIQLTFKNTAGTAIDITGYKAWMTLKKDPDTADNATGNLLITGVILVAANGTMQFSITSVQTAALSVGKYYVGFRYKTLANEIINFDSKIDNGATIQVKPSRVTTTT